ANFNAFLIDLEYNNIAYYIYFVATGNVKIITHAGHFISIKSNRKLIKVNSTPNTQLIKLTSAKHFSGEHSYEKYCTDLATAGVFKWIVELNQKTRQYWSKDNQLLYIENVVMPL
ncbi:DUF1398 domain-containing protein, partial [Salmonella enterica]|nr:DUF1398 domain-containing protein [Salmonella enterica]EFS6123140.1 DUF1398 domain-containing protein [Salmonella enterica subsp. enterica serovar Brandenburg]EIZ2122261.1 DUF1398 family protein [Salmonella enterica subsp. enterica serovar Derby]EMA7496343.1 DUF1398 family protein [Salmonella enterica subsp. enterica serovar Kentucky]ECC0215884.1 DUF1398 domain-containing protein [Salmonella enterica]